MIDSSTKDLTFFQNQVDVVVLGTSNSILRGGWVDGLREGLENQVRNLSAGASASAFVIWQLLDSNLADSNRPSLYLLDTMVNDEYFIEANQYDQRWWFYYVNHIVNALPSEHSMFVAFSTKKFFYEGSIPALILEDMCCNRNMEFISLRRILLSCLKMALKQTPSLGIDDIFEDPGHFHRHLAQLFGAWMSKNLYLESFSCSSNPAKMLRDSGFQTLVPKKHSGLEEIRSTSLRVQKTFYFGLGQNFSLEVEGRRLIHGICIDASNTRAILNIMVGEGLGYSIELGYNTDSPKMQVKYVHFKKPIEIGAEGCMIAVSDREKFRLVRGIHSRPDGGEMHGLRLISFLSGPVISTPPSMAAPNATEANSLTGEEQKAVHESGIVGSLVRQPSLPKYPRSFIEL